MWHFIWIETCLKTYIYGPSITRVSHYNTNSSPRPYHFSRFQRVQCSPAVSGGHLCREFPPGPSQRQQLLVVLQPKCQKYRKYTRITWNIINYYHHLHYYINDWKITNINCINEVLCTSVSLFKLWYLAVKAIKWAQNYISHYNIKL